MNARVNDLTENLSRKVTKGRLATLQREQITKVIYHQARSVSVHQSASGHIAQPLILGARCRKVTTIIPHITTVTSTILHKRSINKR